MKLNSTTSQDYSNMFEVENTTHAVRRFRGAHVSQSGAPKGDPHRFQCYNKNLKNYKDVFGGPIVFLHSGERGHVAALLTLKAKWFATLN